MEVDCILAHGMSYYLKDKTFDCSDKYDTHICDNCGLIANVNIEKNIAYCKACDNKSDFSNINIPYASKLLFYEAQGMSIIPRFSTK